jgi:hypothetical protein
MQGHDVLSLSNPRSSPVLDNWLDRMAPFEAASNLPVGEQVRDGVALPFLTPTDTGMVNEAKSPLTFEDKSNRRYTCSHSRCSKRSFRDKGTRDRHLREIHGSHGLKCPVASCKRSNQGFTRWYNLNSHMKRRHKGGVKSPRLEQLTAALEQATSTRGDDVSVGNSQLDDESESVVDEIMGRPSQVNTELFKKQLQLELERRRAMRSDIDEKIEVLEKTLRVVCSES